MSDVRQRQPMFNLPGVIVAYAGVLIAFHAIRSLLTLRQDMEVLWLFAFIPARYEMVIDQADLGPKIWTFVTYSFLHGDVVHLLVNLLWLAAFGPAVAWRFGPVRFVLFSIATAAGGAAMHLLTHRGEAVAMIGASGVISGLMAGAIRFAFRRGAPLGVGGRSDPSAFRRPAMSLAESFSDPRVLLFIGVWMVINLAFGIGSMNIAGESGSIAWQAHVGGFLVGLLLFGFLDPIPAGDPEEPHYL
ncbi:MAG: rhomboid family intramembrane serine protease [Rhodobiaceae bacterium]|nr:rhomboid family intramembrane serine protease [Rhodobiaceae bacterium]